MTETFNYQNGFAGHTMPVVGGSETIASGAGVLTAFTCLGKITASEKMVIVDSTNDDGSEDIYCILAEDVDATSADVVAAVWYTGEFNENKLVFGGTDDADDHRVAARKLSIFFKSAVSA